MPITRSKKNDGTLRSKRGDTHMGTIKKTYNIDPSVRSDMHLETFLQKKGHNSLSEYISTQKKDPATRQALERLSKK